MFGLDKEQEQRRAVVTMAVNFAQSSSKQAFDPHIILRVFRFLRTNSVARQKYLAAAGCETGFEREHHGKAVLNSRIGREVAQSFAKDIKVARIVEVDGEFCQSYSELLPP